MSRAGGREGRLAAVPGALLAAAALFLLAESAVARRAGADLFLPWAEGAFLPGRTARMAGALALCLILGLTGPGRKLLDRADAALEKDRYRWLAAAALTGLFFLWTFRVTVVRFMTSDEVGILKSIRSVAEKGLRGGANTFSHVLFCGLIGSLYAIDADFWWYTLYHLTAIFFSLTAIGRCIFLLAGRTGGRTLIRGAAAHGLLCVGLGLYTLTELSFTVTPAVAGSAATALLLCRDRTQTRAGRAASDAAAVVLMTLCILQRRQTGQCLLCFFALAAAYQVLRALRLSGAGRSRQILAAAALLLAVGAIYGGSRLITSDSALARDKSFSKAENARSLVVDYLIQDMTPEDFEQAGIPPELGTLLRGWYFMDPRINTQTFRDLAQAYYARTGEQTDAQSGGAGSLGGAVQTLVRQVTGDAYMGRLTLSFLCLTALACLLALTGGRRWPELLCALAAAGGALILLLYLVMGGRFPLRVFLVVMAPACVTALLMALAGAEAGAPPAGAPGGRTALRAVACLFCAGAALGALAGALAVPNVLDTATAEDLFGEQRATEDYANAHPDTLFITNMYEQNLDPFHDARYPGNIDLWGDGGDTARTEGRLYADAFFRDDVQFMYRSSSTVVSLMQYLTLENGPVQALSQAQLTQDIFVATISQVRPEAEDYTGWYECNGMTYYFEDGQAVTGQRVIDGTACTFAPAGAAARVAVSPGPEGLVYSTDAYSLTSPEEHP